LPSAVRVTRRRHPFEGRSLLVLGGMRRHGELELLLVLPDGSKSLIPAGWTDAGPSGVDGDASVATLGSLADLLEVCELVADLAEGGQRNGLERGQAAGKSSCEEDFHAACPAQSDARPVPGATDPGRRGDAGVAGGGGRGGDRPVGRRDRQGRRADRDGGER
jgi:Family of unknown function (DUF5372)